VRRVLGRPDSEPVLAMCQARCTKRKDAKKIQSPERQKDVGSRESNCPEAVRYPLVLFQRNDPGGGSNTLLLGLATLAR